LSSVHDPALEWSFPIVVTALALFSMAIYVRGWDRAAHTRPAELPGWRAVSFVAGLASLWLAIASPIAALDDYLLTAHMAQHFILMCVAPPLIVLGAPTVPFLRGLPRPAIKYVIGPLLRVGSIRRLLRLLTHPLFAWLAMNLFFVAWHVPAMFELALRSEGWHTVEHLCFFWSSLLFWWAVVQPWPSTPIWSRWAFVPYLLSADLVNTGLSAFLAFCGRVLYPDYAAVPRVLNLSPLYDQVAAGAGMWVASSLVYLVAALVILFQLLMPRHVATARARTILASG
jgi:cytochrome c oxidase assembly factor CtaG